MNAVDSKNVINKMLGYENTTKLAIPLFIFEKFKHVKKSSYFTSILNTLM